MGWYLKKKNLHQNILQRLVYINEIKKKKSVMYTSNAALAGISPGVTGKSPGVWGGGGRGRICLSSGHWN